MIIISTQVVDKLVETCVGVGIVVRAVGIGVVVRVGVGRARAVVAGAVVVALQVLYEQIS